VNVDENRRETVDALRDDVAHVIVTHPLTPADNVSLYRLLGAIFGCEAEAAALSAQFCEAAERLRQAVLTRATERVLYLIWRAPWYTVSRETYISATLALCGWLTFPAVAPARYPTLEDDDPLWHDVDRILLSTEPYVFRERDVARLRDRLQQRFGTSPAVSLIDGEMTSWYGSRAIMGLEYLRRLRSE